jgi:protein regulator of cytokinesis 1
MNTLTNRITVLARTLGTAFFPSDITLPAPAAGDASAEPHRDVTPERFSKLEKELVRGKSEVVSWIRVACLDTIPD